MQATLEKCAKGKINSVAKTFKTCKKIINKTKLYMHRNKDIKIKNITNINKT